MANNQPIDGVTKRIRAEKDIMALIDKEIETDQDPRETWLSIKNKMLKDGLGNSRHNEMFAHQYFVNQMIKQKQKEAKVNV